MLQKTYGKWGISEGWCWEWCKGMENHTRIPTRPTLKQSMLMTWKGCQTIIFFLNFCSMSILVDLIDVSPSVAGEIVPTLNSIWEISVILIFFSFLFVFLFFFFLFFFFWGGLMAMSWSFSASEPTSEAPQKRFHLKLYSLSISFLTHCLPHEGF